MQIAERDLDSDTFAAAVARAAWAAERVNRTLAQDDHVTQFELLTAAALWEMAEQGVEVAVVEAGLGGRYDATSVIDSRVTVLTNVGLEHTRWLGPTIKDIAEEKLAVAGAGDDAPARGRPGAGGDGGGAQGGGGARRAHRSCVRRDLGIPAAGAGIVPAAQLRARARRSGGLSPRRSQCARTDRGSDVAAPGDAHELAVRDAAATTAVRGRLQVIEGDPVTVFDGAHNPHAMAALVESLPEVLQGRPTAVVLGSARGQGRRRHAGRAAGSLRARMVHGSGRAVARSRPRRCSRSRGSSGSMPSRASPRRGGR